MTGYISFSPNSFNGSKERHLKSTKRGSEGKASVFRFDGRAYTLKECLHITGMEEEAFRKRLAYLKKRTKITGVAFTWSDFKCK